MVIQVPSHCVCVLHGGSRVQVCMRGIACLVREVVVSEFSGATEIMHTRINSRVTSNLRNK